MQKICCEIGKKLTDNFWLDGAWTTDGAEGGNANNFTNDKQQELTQRERSL